MKKVELKDMIKGRKYYFTNKDNSFAGYLVFDRIEYDCWIKYTLGAGFCGSFTSSEQDNLLFYEIPNDMHIELGTWKHRDMLVAYREGCLASGVELKDGDNWSGLCSGDITFVNDEPEVFEYKGKKYLAEDVDKRFSELKPIN